MSIVPVDRVEFYYSGNEGIVAIGSFVGVNDNGSIGAGIFIPAHSGFTSPDFAITTEPEFGSANEIQSRDSEGALGNLPCETQDMSSNGRFVALDSEASNLVDHDLNGVMDIFVRDRCLQTTSRVSVSSTGEEANGPSRYPTISDNGRWVAFESMASNLVPGVKVKDFNIYLHDRDSDGNGIFDEPGDQRTIWVNAPGFPITPEKTVAFSPHISGCGNYVAFASGQTSLIANDAKRKQNIFVYDRVSGKITRVSLSSQGVEADGDCYEPFISMAGAHVAFGSMATNQAQSSPLNNDHRGFVRDVHNGTTS